MSAAFPVAPLNIKVSFQLNPCYVGLCCMFRLHFSHTDPEQCDGYLEETSQVLELAGDFARLNLDLWLNLILGALLSLHCILIPSAQY